MTGPDDPARAELLARHGEALRLRARFREAAAAFEQAITAFHANGDVRRTAIATSRYSMLLHRLAFAQRHGIAEWVTLIWPSSHF
jgi:hypothetical protein